MRPANVNDYVYKIERLVVKVKVNLVNLYVSSTNLGVQKN